ncbi:MAG: TAT-variant-translocated molybdopterin oxidoreductase [Verrucomicrobiota bacterium]
MKTIPSTPSEPVVGQQYWRSIDQLQDTAEFRQWLEREFPEGASEFTDPVSRRNFVKIMSASFLLAGVGLTGCRRPEEHILPFSKMPEDYVHGVAQFYASAYPTRGTAIPLVVKAHEGRPVKVEGNSQLPGSKGGTDQFAQASLLNLYDVDRAKRFTKDGAGIERNAALDALSKLGAEAVATQGKGMAFLLERSSSPSRNRVQQAIAAKLPQAKWFVYEPVDFDVQRQAATAVFGKEVRPHYQLAEAKRILTLDCDFIGNEQDAYSLIHGFAKNRKTKSNKDEMNRLYTVEALFTLTGANADHRLRVPASAVLPIAAKIAVAILGAKSGFTTIAQALEPIAAQAKVDQKWVNECAKDLVEGGKSSLILAGYQQPLEVHLIAHVLNAALGAVGTTVSYLTADEPVRGTIQELAAALNAGEVTTLAILGGNPVYNAPADLNWSAAQAKAGTVIRLGYTEDESFVKKGWHLPLAHYLESWGDARTSDGTLVPVQPLIQPLFGGITELEVLARLGGLAKTSAYDIVRETFSALGSSSENAWRKFLHDGFLADSAAKAVTVSVSLGNTADALKNAKVLPAPSQNAFEVVFHRSYSVDDGRFANNGWMQETPNPITKVTWDNVVLMSPDTAKALGVGRFNDKSALGLGGLISGEKEISQTPSAERGKFYNEIVDVTVGGKTVSGPIWIVPGMADNVIGLELGYGRPEAGRIARSQKAAAGFNVYPVRTTNALHIAAGAKVAKNTTAEPYEIASTQEHGVMEGRSIIREANLDQYKKQPDFAKLMNLHPAPITPALQGKVKEAPSLYPNPLDEWKDKAVHQWGMAIDLSACVGCTACVVACQSENNVPIVGKDQVRRGREMSWLRLDRYFAGDVLNPQIAFQPMLCQHCEAAPCESVCPVNATAHDEEGLNVMAYNRCVGTRYCSNNCPYKVRRFNYLDYNKRGLEDLVGPHYRTPMTAQVEGEWAMTRWWKSPEKGWRSDEEWELLKLAKNPDVTVRMRGIMEKCSFCVQRIEGAKIAQKVKARDTDAVAVPDGTIKTACQQACPADAIVFGNIKDPNSEVSKWKAQDRDYSVLDFLLTKPRTTYLARIRNQNKSMPDYKEFPGTSQEWLNKHNSFEAHGHADHAGHDHAEHAPKAGETKKGAH